MTDRLEEDPLALFHDWIEEASRKEPNDPNAAALATASASGAPSVRMVLVKGWSADGFDVYTNLGSRKGRELADNPQAALVFHWKSLRRQVRVEGPVTRVPDDEADAYFDSRPRGSRIGAWASEQSRPLPGRWALEGAVAREAARFAIGHIPRPDFWGGFRIRPDRLEFWQDMEFRLHRRWEYVRAEGGAWSAQFLWP